jgi:hypothetical protein
VACFKATSSKTIYFIAKHDRFVLCSSRETARFSLMRLPNTTYLEKRIMNSTDYKVTLREGAERAKHLANDFNAQELFGPSGFLKRCAIVSEADRSLLPEHRKIFCSKIGYKASSPTYKMLRELGERRRRWEAAFNSASSSLAVLSIISNCPENFENEILHGEQVRFMDAYEIQELVVDSEMYL